MKKPELLSPAGNMESLIAAIEGGCDAVYLSGVFYGARSYANNFTNLELEEAIKYAHLYGVKIYVTINTLIYEAEVKKFLSYVEFLQSINVDAVIVQDIGMMDLLRQKYPSLEIHASTQMHIHNLEGVKLLESLGIKRAVLARETPIELVNEIRNNTNLELEIFIHGALCISYSGQCLMSSLIGGRSGNRGTCAQPCRQAYDLMVNDKIINKEKYLLSTKDLNVIYNIDKLIDSGVDSLKIEGRMKRPEYVYYVTKLYRKAIDSYCKNRKIEITEKEIEEISKLFNRKFTNGFLFNERNSDLVNQYRPNHQGIEIGQVVKNNGSSVSIKLSNILNVQDGIRILADDEDVGLTIEKMFKDGKAIMIGYKNDIIDIPLNLKIENGAKVLLTTDYNQLKSISEQIKLSKRKILIDMKAYFNIDEKIKISVNDGINYIEYICDYKVEGSKNAPILKEKIEEQLLKTGNTIYSIYKLEISMDENIFVPVKIINEVRRNILDKLNETRLYVTLKEQGEYSKQLKDYNHVREKSIMISSIDEYNQIKEKDYNYLYMDEEVFCLVDDSRKVLKLSRVIEKHKYNFSNLLIGELGSTIYNNVVSDFSFNVVNSYAVAFLHSIGVKRVTLSYELNSAQIKKIIDNYKIRYNKRPNLELVVSGKIEAMITKYNLLSHYNIPATNAFLLDKYKNKYPLKIKKDLIYIYHFKDLKIDNPDSYYGIGINCLRH